MQHMTETFINMLTGIFPHLRKPVIQDLLTIYTLYIRSILEQSAVVWHSRITEENKNYLERVQKTCLKIIYCEYYQNYSSALQFLQI